MESQVKTNPLNLRPEDLIVRLFKFRRDNPEAKFKEFNLISETHPSFKLVCQNLFNNPLYWEDGNVTSEGFKQFRKTYKAWMIDGFGKPEVTYQEFTNLLRTKPSRVKSVNDEVIYAVIGENGFNANDYSKLFSGTDQYMTGWRGAFWITDSIGGTYLVNPGDLLVREGNTVSKWDKEAFEEEFNTQI